MADGERQGTALFLPLHPLPFFVQWRTVLLSTSIAINIAEPFMNVPHHFFHCTKELLLQHVVCNNFLW
jgi:hypothetical protein